MTKESALENILSYEKAYRESRLSAATWVLEHPQYFPELLRYTMEPHKRLSVQASWALEFVYMKRPEELWAEMDYFFDNLEKPVNDSIVRPISHICEMLCISYYKKRDPALAACFTQAHREKLVDVAFDWLITDQKVACEVRAMTCLYYLGTEFDWIHQELEAILLRKIPTGSGGYKSRGRKTLEQIRKFRSK